MTISSAHWVSAWITPTSKTLSKTWFFKVRNSSTLLLKQSNIKCLSLSISTNYSCLIHINVITHTKNPITSTYLALHLILFLRICLSKFSFLELHRTLPQVHAMLLIPLFIRILAEMLSNFFYTLFYYSIKNFMHNHSNNSRDYLHSTADFLFLSNISIVTFIQCTWVSCVSITSLAS